MAITKGGTPTHTFNCNVDLSEAVALYITYAQNGRNVLEKQLDDCEITATNEGCAVQCKLTQENTLAFADSNKRVEIQIRAKLADGAAFVSEIVETTVSKLLKPGAI